ncbi:MAG TPA: hypothetical protein VFU49_12335 [Ktedonobacteraceae bacterium]|nr:hypothetical protein [Ktedonobacteraceae bacterium]
MPSVQPDKPQGQLPTRVCAKKEYVWQRSSQTHQEFAMFPS